MQKPRRPRRLYKTQLPIDEMYAWEKILDLALQYWRKDGQKDVAKHVLRAMKELYPEIEDVELLVSDPVHFVKTLFGVILFIYQKEIIYACLDNNLVLVIKGRQIGATFAAAVLALWFASTHERKRVLILALWRKQARRTLDYIKEILYSNPVIMNELVDMPYGLTREEIRFRNATIIETSGVSRPTGDNVRSKVAHLLIIDEAVLLLDRQFGAVSPVTSYTHGNRLWISTAGAKGCLFHKKVELARLDYEKTTTWSKGRLFELPACRLSYDKQNNPVLTDILCPKQTKEKLLEELEDLGELRFRREYCCEWLGTENQMFPEVHLLKKNQRIQVADECWGGLDVGEVVHPTVLIVLKGNRQKSHTIFRKEWRRPMKRKQKAKEIVSILKRLKVRNLCMDSTGIGIGLHADLEEFGAPLEGVSYNEKVKNKLMFELREALKEEWLLVQEEQEQTLYELRGFYAMPIEGTSFFKFDCISSDHDVNALALAWKAIPETYISSPSIIAVKDKRILG